MAASTGHNIVPPLSLWNLCNLAQRDPAYFVGYQDLILPTNSDCMLRKSCRPNSIAHVISSIVVFPIDEKTSSCHVIARGGHTTEFTWVWYLLGLAFRRLPVGKHASGRASSAITLQSSPPMSHWFFAYLHLGKYLIHIFLTSACILGTLPYFSLAALSLLWVLLSKRLMSVEVLPRVIRTMTNPPSIALGGMTTT